MAAKQPDSSLRLPAQKRILLSASQRLNTITEGSSSTPSTPPIPRRSSKRNSALYVVSTPRGRSPRRWSGSATSGDTSRTAPPAYDWVPELTDSVEELNAPVEGEKLAELRRREQGGDKTRRRGGWRRLIIIIALVVFVAVGLAVGLGVGLTSQKHKQNDADQSNGPSPDTGLSQKFPLGQYSMVTALKTVQTTCTSNPATWRCYPYAVFNPTDGSTNSSSLASFNWIITNTSSIFATNTSSTTPPEGIPANLTVGAQNDPFSITFPDKPLTYISSSSNSSSARLTFSFTMPKLVIPSPPIATKTSECFFNETQFTGTLYLSAPRNYPSGDLADSTTLDVYAQWPYAVDVTQSAAGGQNVPNCYETLDGAVGARITAALVPQPEIDECLCAYRNF